MYLACQSIRGPPFTVGEKTNPRNLRATPFLRGETKKIPPVLPGGIALLNTY
jgi:hypothetical protein